ncbi:MAG TPA: imidazole glycerol phosphate synthase subunit HisH [Halanaerobiales bacterium]|nr:imidazole glycerol phosphate synthase subunit HisH [Halanaerobiales bacterium]
MIAVIDYELGNTGSVVKAFKYLGFPVCLTADFQEIQRADRIVLPGVGAFGEGMENLRNRGLEKIIRDEINKGKLFFGICLGMQLLLTKSEEEENIKGLNLINGQVRRFKGSRVGKVPQIGWNQVNLLREDLVFRGIKKDYLYFVHSYFVEPAEKSCILGLTNYGKETFASIIRKDNIWGMQCHPEKSGKTGLQILKNFGEVVYNGNYTGN